VSTEAAFTQTFLTDLPKATKDRLLEEEGQMAAADSLQRATDEAKNALEEYVYALRSKVQGECQQFVKEADGAALVSELNDVENWLYEDGEDEKKSVRASPCRKAVRSCYMLGAD
jgi:heat shock 70kDa protein 4